MSTSLKKLPIGIQTFREIIEEGDKPILDTIDQPERGADLREGLQSLNYTMRIPNQQLTMVLADHLIDGYPGAPPRSQFLSQGARFEVLPSND